jgi:hypothetical protein
MGRSRAGLSPDVRPKRLPLSARERAGERVASISRLPFPLILSLPKVEGPTMKKTLIEDLLLAPRR